MNNFREVTPHNPMEVEGREEKHTPLPWTFEEIPNGSRPLDGLGYISGADSGEVTHHGVRERSREENLANAELIVTAVNAYPTLIASVEEAKKALEPFAEFADWLDAEFGADIPDNSKTDQGFTFGDVRGARKAYAVLSSLPTAQDKG